MKLDHESRAHRFLDSMTVVQCMLAQMPPDADLKAEGLHQLFSLLSDEARVVVVPFRMGVNDDDPGG